MAMTNAERQAKYRAKDPEAYRKYIREYKRKKHGFKPRIKNGE